MMTLIVLVAAVALVVAAGEAVRLQCRRMLDRPVRFGSSISAATTTGTVTALHTDSDAAPAAAAA
jgi:predicted permease